MGLFHRVSDILKANINRMLDQAEDPELVLDQLIQEMQESYRKSKIEVAKALADEKRLKHLLATNQEMAGKWGRKAVLAVEKSDDDLAREALKRKRSYEDISHEFQAQWTEQKKVTDVLRENLFGLESKIDEARRKKSLLVARQKRAVAQKKLQDTLEQASTDQSYWMLGQFEDKITEIEARAEAEIDLIDGELSGRFRELESHPENVEDELSQLKSQVAGRKATDQKLLSTELDEKEAALAEQAKRVAAEAVDVQNLAASVEVEAAASEAPSSSAQKSEASEEGTALTVDEAQKTDDASAAELMRRVTELAEYARTGVRPSRTSDDAAEPRREPGTTEGAAVVSQTESSTEPRDGEPETRAASSDGGDEKSAAPEAAAAESEPVPAAANSQSSSESERRYERVEGAI